jgi:hypothetical protein
VEYQNAGWEWSGFLDGSWRITTPDGAVHFVAREYFPLIEEAIQYVIDKRQEQ